MPVERSKINCILSTNLASLADLSIQGKQAHGKDDIWQVSLFRNDLQSLYSISVADNLIDFGRPIFFNLQREAHKTHKYLQATAEALILQSRKSSGYAFKAASLI